MTEYKTVHLVHHIIPEYKQCIGLSQNKDWISYRLLDNHIVNEVKSHGDWISNSSLVYHIMNEYQIIH